MKKFLFLVIALLIATMLLGCGTGSVKTTVDSEIITVDAEFISKVEAEFANPNNYSLQKYFSKQPCTVSLLVDSTTVGKNSSVAIDKNTVYGRIIKPYDEALLGKCDFKLDSVNGGAIPVSVVLADSAVQNLTTVIQQNDIITFNGNLKSINKVLAYNANPASSFNKLVEIVDCEIAEHIPVTEVAAAQQKYKDAEAAAKKQKEEEELKKIADEEAELEKTITKENAKRAAVVSLTNAVAVDVFAADGDTVDSSKFHTYADTSGKYLDIKSDGVWSVKNNNTWHVDSLKLTSVGDRTVLIASLDVSFDGMNYIISNISGTHGNEGAPTEYLVDINSFYGYTQNASCTVSPELIKDDRVVNAQQTENNSSKLSNEAARDAFEKYGRNTFPYGFKCHWLMGNIMQKQEPDGSWSLKVEVTVKNQYGEEEKTIAEGVVKGTTANPTVESFFVYR